MNRNQVTFLCEMEVRSRLDGRRREETEGKVRGQEEECGEWWQIEITFVRLSLKMNWIFPLSVGTPFVLFKMLDTSDGGGGGGTGLGLMLKGGEEKRTNQNCLCRCDLPQPIPPPTPPIRTEPPAQDDKVESFCVCCACGRCTDFWLSTSLKCFSTCRGQDQ